MKKIGILVGDKGDWKFFQEIFEDINSHYQTTVYEEKIFKVPLLYGRLNRWAYQNGIRSVMKHSDLSFFEWSTDLLATASHMPKCCKIVARLHSYELYAWAPLINWDNVDRIILVSQAMREKFSELYPNQASKTEVVYNAKALDKFTPVDREFNMDLGMLGSINPRKRVYEVILMLDNLRQQGYNPRLHIAGGRHHAPDFDEYYVATHRLVNKLGMEDHVIFYDHVTNTADWLHNIDIFISNSYWEGHQVSLIEAMASGCCCFSHFWDGAEEVLPAEYLYRNETELQQKIIEHVNLSLEEKLERRAKMRAIAIEKYDLKQQQLQIRHIIEDTLTVK